MKQEPFSATMQTSGNQKPLQASGSGKNDLNGVSTDRQEDKRATSSFPATEPLSPDFRIPKGVRLSVKPLKEMQIQESSSDVSIMGAADGAVSKKRTRRLLGATGGTKRDSLKTISEAEALSLSKQASKYILKHNNNLDLGEYD